MPCKSEKKKRQYEHIKQTYLNKGKSEDKAEEIAARTVKKASYIHHKFLEAWARK